MDSGYFAEHETILTGTWFLHDDFAYYLFLIVFMVVEFVRIPLELLLAAEITHIVVYYFICTGIATFTAIKVRVVIIASIINIAIATIIVLLATLFCGVLTFFFLLILSITAIMLSVIGFFHLYHMGLLEVVKAGHLLLYILFLLGGQIGLKNKTWLKSLH